MEMEEQHDAEMFLPSEFKYCSDLNTTLFVKRMLEAEKPDFIAFTGTRFY